jgi:aminopeptidase N
VLKQLAFVLGDESFRDGLRSYLKDHLYANAEWSDLVHAFERASGENLDRWADMWIRHRGMPQVDVSWTCINNHIFKFTLTQHDVLSEGDVWPIATQILLSTAGANPTRLRVQFSGATYDVSAAVGRVCPDYIFTNDRDEAYGRFLLDTRSRDFVLRELPAPSQNRPQQMENPFNRALLWGSLWEGVRVADLAPRRFIEEAEKALPHETDESLTATLAGHAITALHHYVSAPARSSLSPALESLAADRMLHSPEEGLRIVWFRGLRAAAETPDSRARLKELLSGKLSIPGVDLRPLDRWNLVATLIALNDADASAVFNAEKQRDHTGDGLKYAYMAEAARPDAATKKRYFDDYLRNPARPEDWIEQSLGAFNYWNQSELTYPYLRPALDALPQIKRERKIFFLVGWLDAFIGGQNSPAADKQVYDFLHTATIDHDVELKILQAVDELDRRVMIRQKFPE